MLVKEAFDLDPFSQGLFVFCNRSRNKMKTLLWEHNGFWLHYRRLERGKFNWPPAKTSVVSISYREFRWLLDGLALKQAQAHKAVKQRTIL